jgi:hypothetical protein
VALSEVATAAQATPDVEASSILLQVGESIDMVAFLRLARAAWARKNPALRAGWEKEPVLVLPRKQGGEHLTKLSMLQIVHVKTLAGKLAGALNRTGAHCMLPALAFPYAQLGHIALAPAQGIGGTSNVEGNTAQRDAERKAQHCEVTPSTRVQ